jgi:signal transduction histidine kinase
MFSRRLTLALVLLAVLSLGQGLLAWRLGDVAADRVLRGRVAADLQSGFLDLSATKQRLRAWSLQALIGAEPEPGAGERLGRRMAEIVGDLKRLGTEAERLDRGGDRAGHRERAEALVLLDTSVRALSNAVAALDRRETIPDARAAWSALERVFDVSADRDLRALLDESIARETLSLRRERSAADASLAGVKGLTLSMSALIVALAIGLAMYFARALRRPVAALRAGAAALRAGDLGHRIPEKGMDEFAGVARGMNQMAGELLERRTREAGQRSQLEARVAERTAELQATLSDLQHSQARRRQLLGEIGHELRTPTTAILGEAEITLRGGDKPPEDYRAALGRIGQTARQLGGLIDDLLTVARTDADALSVDLQPVDVAEPYREALAHARGLAAQRRIRLVADKGASAVVSGDPQRLQQLMTLLVDNAIRYSHEGGTVSLSTAVGPSGWTLAIVDAGIGIHPEDLPHVFERAFRGRGARAHRPDGTGLGLAIARTLVDRHRAHIEIGSEPGAGTHVALTLPLHQDPS